MRAKLLVIFTLLLALLSACGVAEQTASSSQTSVSAPAPGPVVPVGEPEVHDLGPTNETVWNCGGGGGTLVKHPSMSVITGHAVEWEVGGVTGVGVVIGEGIVPGGINLSASLEGRYTSHFDQSIQQGTAWELPAAEDTLVVYTIMWREVWQRGYVDTRLADQSIVRVNVRYRTGIQSEIVGKRQDQCRPATVESAANESSAISSSLPASQPTPLPQHPPTPQPIEPTSLPVAQPVPQTQPQSLGLIRIFGNSRQGEQLRVEKAGVYRFEYRSGAYAVFPEGAAPNGTKTWLTAIFFFDGDRSKWDGERIKDDELLLRLADTKYWASQAEAENSAQGQYVETHLNAGQVITLTAVDAQSAYADNPGQVIIEYFYVGE